MASFSLSLLPTNDDHGCLCPILIHHKPTTEIKYPPHHAPQTDHLTIVTASWSPHKGHHALVTILWPPHHSTHPSLSQDIRLETFQTWQNNNSLHLLVLPGGCHHAVATRRGCQQLDTWHYLTQLSITSTDTSVPGNCCRKAGRTLLMADGTKVVRVKIQMWP